jgi:hypothetical protein
MKQVLVIIFTVCILGSCKAPRADEPVNEQIRLNIQKNCAEGKPCQVRLKDSTNFSWDKLYVFDIAVEPDVISEMLNINFDSSGSYSRKWFFIKDNQVVHFEQKVIIVGGDSVVDGDVSLNEDAAQEKYSIFGQDALFEVSKNKYDGTRSYYYLRCVNCK